MRIWLQEEHLYKLLRKDNLKGDLMKILNWLIILVFLSVVVCSDLYAQDNRDVVSQISTIDALLAGVFDGEVTFKNLRVENL